MQALYLLSDIKIVALLVLTVLILAGQCVFCQMALSTWQAKYTKRVLLEGSVVFFIFVLCIVIAAANYQIVIGLPGITKYQELRYLSCFMLLAQTPFWYRSHCGMGYLIVGTLLGFPLWDVILAPWNLILALLMIALRVIVGCFKVRTRIRHELSMGSIKEAMDSLPVGILFAKPDGEVLLANSNMLSFMDRYVGEQYRDANQFWQRLWHMEPAQDIQKIYVGDQLLFRMHNKESLLISRDILQKEKRKYQQVTIVDVTEEDRSAIELASQQQQLKDQSNRLRHILTNLEAYKRQQVLSEVASQIHDLLGQRITILQQILNNKRFTDYVSMIPLVNSLIRDMRSNIQENPQDILNTIIDTYTSIGVVITVTGVLPDHQFLARTFVSIIREGATNAVRHGHANQVFVELMHAAGRYSLTITDNGIPPAGPVTCGTGLKGIRTRIERLGGLLLIQEQPRFTVRVELDERLLIQEKAGVESND